MTDMADSGRIHHLIPSLTEDSQRFPAVPQGASVNRDGAPVVGNSSDWHVGVWAVVLGILLLRCETAWLPKSTMPICWVLLPKRSMYTYTYTIYAYIGVVWGVNVSIYGSPMECMGIGT